MNYPSRVVSRLASLPEHSFIAIPLALVHHLRSYPPHDWVEPKQRFNAHVDGGCQIIHTPYVAKFMPKDGLELLWRQPIRNSFGQQKNRTKKAENPRFHHRWCGEDRDGTRDGKPDGPPCSTTYRQPVSEPAEQQKKSSDQPYCE
jgi:hypothetical protein